MYVIILILAYLFQSLSSLKELYDKDSFEKKIQTLLVQTTLRVSVIKLTYKLWFLYTTTYIGLPGVT